MYQITHSKTQRFRFQPFWISVPHQFKPEWSFRRPTNRKDLNRAIHISSLTWAKKYLDYQCWQQHQWVEIMTCIVNCLRWQGYEVRDTKESE